MRVPDQCLLDLRERGYLVFEGFLDANELAAAQEALWLHFPQPEEYFADAEAHAWLGTSQFAGIIGGPWRSWDLNRLTFHPDLLDLAERFFSVTETALLRALPLDRRSLAFLACWTRKEAFIKALGFGLSCPLDAFDVTIDPDTPARITRVEERIDTVRTGHCKGSHRITAT